MSARCLSQYELTLFLKYIELLDNKVEIDSEWAEFFEGIKYYDNRAVIITYFICFILRKRMGNIEKLKLLEDIYGCFENLNCEFQSFDKIFVAFLLKNNRIEDISLEEQIIEIQNDIIKGQNF